MNRRYQRKLVWSLGQKRQLIDSILNDIPIPLVLSAKSDRSDGAFEIIDGLQRMNAIVSFIENMFSYDGKYFNLESLGLTKYLMGEGRLKQGVPKMSREQSLKIAQYMIPVSTYSSEASSLVDETFRRINSSGRKLGMQEVRQAGSTSRIADLVRSISAEIRGDLSRSDVISLGEMTKISRRWKDEGDGPGVPVDDVFWIREGILRRDDLRSSKDEQLVLDLLVDILLDGSEDTSTELRDDVYDTDSRVGKKIISALAGVSESDTLPVRFKRVLELMSKIGQAGSANFWTRHTGKSTNDRTARYSHIAFRGFYTLLS